ncbi:GNAT family N-acetyltransferase [Meiothermus granaticius]|uniref:Putative ribosomal N-acetyltransferase YdaF n=1 Tax=Meiothermus granaticius NBRC 107808 TaxID=1227551 RepID=A0A399FF23_9DEIN|nr:GNAT family protein [Meiothermus granaticius]RIH93671.1 putative ribosomal N-acetyltransferase YdaF [Meiothermus granaticius NBRC 107808]GEM86833.1 N-acetyltransferase [Meiothermus granaticius NBRC 107808]
MPDLILRPLVLADISTIMAWTQDEEFCLASGWPLHQPPERWEEIFLRMINNPPVNLVRLGIETHGQLIGYTDLGEINPLEARASFAIAIGDRGYWGRGYGFTAGRQMLRYGFEEQGLERITAEVHASNTRPIRLLERLGFLREGVLRQHETYRGEKQDLYLYGMLKEEFKALVDLTGSG